MIGYMQVDGAPGESKDSKHPDWIKIDTLSWGTTRPVASSASSHRASDRATLSDVVVTKEMDKSSPKLFEFANQGHHIPKIKIELTTSMGTASGDSLLLHIELSDSIVSSFHATGELNAAHHPKEVVAFNFAHILVKYQEYKPDGNPGGVIDTTWDVKTNKK